MAFDASFNPIAELGPVAAPRERLVILRNFLAALPPERFNMATWYAPSQTTCGTVACIGGWACVLFDLRDATGGFHRSPADVGEYLGLPVPDAWKLFYPPTLLHLKGQRHRPYDVPLEGAIKVIDHYLATGEVRWSEAYA